MEDKILTGQVRSGGTDPSRHFCSIRYVDEEGEQVIRHAFLTVDEQKLVVEEFARRGMKGEVFDLNPAAVRLSE